MTARTKFRWTLLLLGGIVVVEGLLAQTSFPASAKVDSVLVLKQKRVLRLLHGKDVVKEFRVALGSSPVGPKMQQGDHKTPEGFYVLDSRNPHSKYYKSLYISYPNAGQREAARKHGVSPGGDVFIHGLPNGYRGPSAAHRFYDWTDGCIAVTDAEMDQIWNTVPNGTPIEIRP